MYPIEQGTDKGMLVESNQVIEVLLCGTKGLCPVTQGSMQELCHLPTEIPVQKLATQAVVDVDHYLPVILEIGAHVTDCSLTIIVCPAVGVLAGKLLTLIDEHPIEQIVYILEMIIECLPVDSATVYNFLDGDFVQGSFSHQLLQ